MNCTESNVYYKQLSVLSLSLCTRNSVNLAGAAAEVVGNFFDANVWCVVYLQALKIRSIRLIETSNQEGD